jgi:hypothetical protein
MSASAVLVGDLIESDLFQKPETGVTGNGINWDLTPRDRTCKTDGSRQQPSFAISTTAVAAVELSRSVRAGSVSSGTSNLADRAGLALSVTSLHHGGSCLRVRPTVE